MDPKRRTRRDFLQNITIVLLSLSAVFLFTQTQLYSLGVDAGSDYLRYLGGAQTSAVSETAALTSLSAPVRLAVTGVYGGRYGSVAGTTTDEVFEPVGGLLREALRSVQSLTPCEPQEFLRALEGTSIYFDFLEPLPLPVLAGLVGASLESGVSARRLVISAQGAGEAVLYLWDGEEDCRRSTTAVSEAELESVVGGYELNGASFALDGGTGPESARMDPCSLFPLEPPALPVLSSAAVLPDSATLLTALGFYPRTNSRYTESGGVEVVTDGDRTLRLSPDGSIRYRSGGDPAISIAAAGEDPTVTEAVMGVSALLNNLLTTQESGAGLYLLGVRETESTQVLSFGWQSGGVPIRLDRGGAAAEVTLSGNVVSMLTLRFRQYADTGELSLLLPLRQALAIAARQEGAELSIGYVDDGATASASWLAD